MSTARRAKIEEAFREALVVQFEGPYEPGSTLGYVLDIGPQFFLLGYIDDRIRFNGFQCYRFADVRKLRSPASTAQFIRDALLIRRESIDAKPDIDLSSISALLQSARPLFPLITIHREKIDPNTCKIGKIVAIDETQVKLLEIDADAVWLKKPTTLRLNDITRVDFGGDYEEALHLVSGDPGYSKKTQI